MQRNYAAKGQKFDKIGIMVLKDVIKITKVCRKMPEEYERKAVLEWAEQYDKIFTAK